MLRLDGIELSWGFRSSSVVQGSNGAAVSGRLGPRHFTTKPWYHLLLPFVLMGRFVVFHHVVGSSLMIPRKIGIFSVGKIGISPISHNSIGLSFTPTCLMESMMKSILDALNPEDTYFFCMFYIVL